MEIRAQEDPLGQFNEFRKRFMASVYPEPNSGCWLWSSKPTKHGYGRFCFNRHHIDYAHRVSWRLHRGEIPPGLHVLHKCDLPCCVNPSHLFLGTQGDNNRDMCAKGRQWMQRPGRSETAIERWNREHPERLYRGERHHIRRNPHLVRGENNGRARLTRADVLEMRRLHSEGHSFKSIARQFGVSKEGARYAISRPWGGLAP